MIAILQHGPEEPPALIQEILRERGELHACIPLYDTNEVPALDAGGVIVLGGQMSANDEQDHPFLKPEKELIRDCVRSGRAVLGVCLGAQLIAGAAGARVYGGTREAGWRAVERVGADAFAVPERCMVFEWHCETFDLPQGARLLYRGSAVGNQAFTLGSAIGVQFHMEVTGDLIRRWIRDLKPGERDAILRETERYLQQSQDLCRKFVDAFIRRC
ncbi:MAG: type 1 glutamine amidotransferase [Methanomicrobiales archaeon]|nr:type 1 glutamine amidotransferase [Methanomicrobiales archaeon]MDI6876824.1 type 1 glutamine amidotransferase [Methanomicrobiales archaeon]